MAPWDGEWLGMWESGAEAGAGLNAALVVVGTGSSAFTAQLLAAPPAIIDPAIFFRAKVRKKPKPISAALVVDGAGAVRFSPQLGQAIEAQLVVGAWSGWVFRAKVLAPAALVLAGSSSATMAPVLAKAEQASLAAQAGSGATFGAQSSVRQVVVPLTRKVELADDEIAAVLLLLAA